MNKKNEKDAWCNQFYKFERVSTRAWDNELKFEMLKYYIDNWINPLTPMAQEAIKLKLKSS